MASQEKILKSKALIRFQDCDPYQHLNNASYINYFINAREDQVLKHYGLDIYKTAREKGVSWIVGQNQIAYFRPALVMEEVVIESQLIKYGDKSLAVEMRMYNQSQSELKAVLWVTFIHFNLKTSSSQSHSAEFSDLFQNIVLPVAEDIFENRVMALRKK
ncbi:MAG: acyl-CoA thioesterase [Cytophagaceae bacterium]|jgi:thioesterase-3